MKHSKQLCLKQRYAAFSNPCILEFLLHLCSWQEPSGTRLSSYIVSSTLFDPNIFKHHKILFVTIVKPMNFSFQKSSISCSQVYFYPRFSPFFTPFQPSCLRPVSEMTFDTLLHCFTLGFPDIIVCVKPWTEICLIKVLKS